MALWLALRFPHWALDSRGDGAGSRAGALVAENRAGRRRVVAAGRQSLRQGVRRGMALADAQIYAPAAQIGHRRPAAEQDALERLAGRTWRYSDQVHIACAGEAVECTRLVTEIGASRRLFGGLDRLARTIRADLKSLGYRYRTGLGASPQAALACARARRRIARLEDLPLACLALEPRTRQSLHASGLATTGELLALPPAALARRYGTRLLDYLERLRARRPHGLSLYPLPETYRTRHELTGAVETTQGLAFVLRRAFTELAAFLRGGDAAIQALQITLVHESVAASVLTLRLSTPTREAAHFERVANDRLEQTRLAAPVLEIGLASDRLRPCEHAQSTLWHDDHSAGRDRWPAVLDRLRARLGHDAVRWLHAPADHRPERAAVPRDRPAETVPADRRPRPLWLLDAPRPATGALELIAGPERIETGWWDDAGIRRDYYRARDAHGRLLWVYRDLGDAPGDARPIYYLHGLFA